MAKAKKKKAKAKKSGKASKKRVAVKDLAPKAKSIKPAMTSVRQRVV